jgi:hypothetical protein
MTDGNSGRISFDDLKLETISFEARFEPSYLIWDKAGAIWSEVLKFFPELKMRQAEPHHTVFGLSEGHELQVVVQSSSIAITAILPDKKLEVFSDITEHVMDSCARHLLISEYSRLGLRASFIKEFDTPAAAADAVISTGYVRAPTQQEFGVSSSPIGVEYSIRREDGKNGYVLWLKAQSIKIEAEPAFGLGPYMKPIHEMRHKLSLEVDSYLMARASVSQIRFTDWIAQTYHIIRRDGSRLLEG